MELMKYSIEATNPWMEKYFDKYNSKDSSNFRNIKNFFKFWISSYDDELRNLFNDRGSSSNQMAFASGWR